MKRKVLDSIPRYFPRALILFYQKIKYKELTQVSRIHGVQGIRVPGDMGAASTSVPQWRGLSVQHAKNGLQPSISLCYEQILQSLYLQRATTLIYSKSQRQFICFVRIKTSFPCSTIDYSYQRQEQTYAKQGLSKLLSFLQRERQNSNLTVLKLRK